MKRTIQRMAAGRDLRLRHRTSRIGGAWVLVDAACTACCRQSLRRRTVTESVAFSASAAGWLLRLSPVHLIVFALLFVPGCSRPPAVQQTASLTPQESHQRMLETLSEIARRADESQASDLEFGQKQVNIWRVFGVYLWSSVSPK